MPALNRRSFQQPARMDLPRLPIGPNVIRAFTLCAGALLVAHGYAQSDAPCDAPFLPVHLSQCEFMLGTTVGVTYASDAANGGVPPCAFPGSPDVWYRV